MRKMMMIVLLGGLALSLAACGNSPAEQQQSTTVAQGQAMNSSKLTETRYQTIYKNSVFMGDSITEGLSFYDVLKQENVLAGAGKTAEFALEDIDELTKRSPKQVYIQLGSDDILWPVDNPIAYSIQNYAKLIARIKEKLPQTQITLLTVTPVSAKAVKQEPRYNNISDYNQALKELAEQENIGFVDLSPLFTSGSDALYDSDGIHFTPEYYTKLLDLLKDQVK